MNSSNQVSEEILGLEKRYWKAMQEHDLQSAIELTDFPCVVAGAQGIRSVDRAQYEMMFNSQNNESIRSVEFDPSNAEVRLVNSETAIIAYQIRTKFTHNGSEIDMNAVDTSTWVKRDGKWVCAMHTETEMKKH